MDFRVFVEGRHPVHWTGDAIVWVIEDNAIAAQNVAITTARIKTKVAQSP
jgi:hypothetical protein